ncbi:hypothetical protein BRD04_10885 [Halobacteriales archaeon QS_9_67_17]|nr:MAG: hypothetical protein BRD04_10885 [Halobacteriales archaeon QS_9_67_17]
MGSDRAVSTTLGYALTLGITTLLITGLLVGMGGFIEDQRERAIRSELEVVGQQLAADVEAGDRFVGAGDTDFSVQRSLPNDVVGVSYRISVVVDGTDTYLRLTTSNPAVTVEVDMALTASIAETTVTGGQVVVTYDAGSGNLEVRSDA